MFNEAEMKTVAPLAALCDALKGYDNYQLLDVLRARGLVICAFVGQDVIAGHCPDYLDDPPPKLDSDAWDWLAEHAEQVEDAMVQAGNAYIAFAHDPIAISDEDAEAYRLYEESGDERLRTVFWPASAGRAGRPAPDDGQEAETHATLPKGLARHDASKHGDAANDYHDGGSPADRTAAQ